MPQPDHYASKTLWSQGAFCHLPARIIMYRDGVSDGEFRHVIRVGGAPPPSTPEPKHHMGRWHRALHRRPEYGRWKTGVGMHKKAALKKGSSQG